LAAYFGAVAVFQLTVDIAVIQIQILIDPVVAAFFFLQQQVFFMHGEHISLQLVEFDNIKADQN